MTDFAVKNVPMFPTRHAPVVRSDTVNMDYPSAILVMATGDVSVADKFGVSFTYLAVPAYTILPITVSRVNLTGTTVVNANLVALYGES